jgi:DNA-binding LacI/PurR family transcriptional regulator
MNSGKVYLAPTGCFIEGFLRGTGAQAPLLKNQLKNTLFSVKMVHILNEVSGLGVTIKDVAKLAGVSHTTVSMVLHNDPRITEETREKVQKAIKEIDYHPNIFARSLIRGKTNIIAIVTSHFYFSSFFEITALSGMELSNISFKNKYVINHFSTGGTQETKDELLKKILYGKMADGVILLNMKPSKEVLKDFKAKGLPIVLVDELAKGAHSVKSDNVKGAFIATEYLLKQGRKNICFLNTRYDDLALTERKEGYKAALKKYNIEFNPESVISSHNFLFESGTEAAGKILDSGKKFDAVFSAAGDVVCMGVLKGLKERGVRVPEEIALVGYDDIYPSMLSEPPLTTIRQPVRDIGKAAFDIAIEAVETDITEDKIITFEPSLVIRGSA